MFSIESFEPRERRFCAVLKYVDRWFGSMGLGVAASGVVAREEADRWNELSESSEALWMLGAL